MRTNYEMLAEEETGLSIVISNKRQSSRAQVSDVQGLFLFL